MKIILLVFSLLFIQNYSPVSADEITGIWLTGKGDARVNIFKSGDKYYGSIVWLKNPEEDGKPKLDKHNPDPKLRNKPVMGLMILRGFSYENSTWTNGKIYDPKNGKDYSCKMTLSDKNKLDVRGYIGISLIGRTETWTRQP